MDVVADKARYEADRARDIALAGDRGFKAAIEANKLDALMFPGWTISNLASRPGYPEIVVPIGMVPAAAEAAARTRFRRASIRSRRRTAPRSSGCRAANRSCIEIAYAFEQATKKRVPPALPVK